MFNTVALNKKNETFYFQNLFRRTHTPRKEITEKQNDHMWTGKIAKANKRFDKQIWWRDEVILLRAIVVIKQKSASYSRSKIDVI